MLEEHAGNKGSRIHDLRKFSVEAGNPASRMHVMILCCELQWISTLILAQENALSPLRAAVNVIHYDYAKIHASLHIKRGSHKISEQSELQMFLETHETI